MPIGRFKQILRKNFSQQVADLKFEQVTIAGSVSNGMVVVLDNCCIVTLSFSATLRTVKINTIQMFNVIPDWIPCSANPGGVVFDWAVFVYVFRRGLVRILSCLHLGLPAPHLVRQSLHARTRHHTDTT